MLSRRNDLSFDGQLPELLAVYVHPYTRLDEVLRRFNNLLAASSLMDLEANFAQYSSSLESRQKHGALCREASAQMAKIDAGLAARTRVSSAGSPQQETMCRYDDVLRNRECVTSELEYSRAQIVSVTQEMQAVVESIWQAGREYQDAQAIRSYFSR